MGHSRSQPQKTSPLPQKMSRLHGSCGTRLPRGGRAGRVLPAADAVAAKAEGVAHKPHRNQTKRLALRPNLRAKRVRAHCVEHYPSGDAGASTAAERRFPSADKIPRFHGFRSTRLPRDGRVGRVLPAADAVAAKAEGVGHPYAAFSPRCASTAAKLTSTASGEGLPPTFLPKRLTSAAHSAKLKR